MTSPDLFAIAPGSAEPIYRQLIELVKRRVAAGQLAPGEELPSVRELAHALAVHPMTISKAYSLLEAEGVLQRRRGLAMVVAETAAQQASDPAELLKPTLQRAAQEARQLGLSETQVVSLWKTVFREMKES